MAYATKVIVTKMVDKLVDVETVVMRKELRTVKEETERVTLDLSKEEARVVMTLVGNILGGNRIRKVTDDIYSALEEEGIEPFEGNDFFVGNSRINVNSCFDTQDKQPEGN